MSTQPALTIFTAPKPFVDAHIATIQHNALACFASLQPAVQVLVIGEEPGLADAAAEHGLDHISVIKRNERGTPLINSIFDLARQNSQAELLAYLNADILVLPDFIEAARQTARQLQEFLLIGQRWDLDVRQRLDFSHGWETRLRADVQQRGRLHLPAGSDYFIFPKTLLTDLPPFAVGRAGWDNWMIYHAKQQGWAVVDATPSTLVIHQDHDYRHLPGGKPHYTQPESQANEALAGGSANLYMVLDSDRQLINGRIRPPRGSFLRLLRRIEVAMTPADGKRSGWRWSLARRARRWRRRITGSLQ